MNTFIESIANHPMTNQIGMVLIHFLWQAALVAIVFGAILKMQARCSSQTRYLTALLGLLVMSLLPLMALVISDRGAEFSESVASNVVGSDSNISLQSNGGVSAGIAEAAVVEALKGPGVEPVSDSHAFHSEFTLLDSLRLRAILPWFVTVWCIGVLSLAIRLMLGLNRIRLWRQSATEIATPKLMEMRDRLCKQMGLKKPIRFLESVCSSSPFVVGWIRPAVLIPSSIISGLTPRELEVILVHELAHIRRHDYLINIAQAIIETVLFYHPAVWWLSNRVRVERENCCDDIAIELFEDRKTFVNALAKVETIRCRDFQVVVAAGGGSLINRMRRILDKQPPHGQSVWPAGIVAFVSITCLVASLMVSSGSSAALAESSKPTQQRGTQSGKTESKSNTNDQNQQTIKPSVDTKEGQVEEWGPAPEQGNLRLSLTLKEGEAKEGQPVLATLAIKNFGDSDESYDWQNFDAFRAIRVSNTSNESDQYVGGSWGTSGQVTSLKPGESKVLWKSVDVGSFYMLDQGEYKIQVAPFSRRNKTIPKSNIVTLKVKEGEQPPLKRLVKNLSRVAPKGWKVFIQSDVVIASHNPTGMKQDNISIQISFTSEPIAEGRRSIKAFSPPIVTELGHANLLSNAKAAEYWPNHEEKISEALKSIK